MPDQAPNRPGDLPTSESGQGKNDSQLRLVTAEGNVVFPGDAEPDDTNPTVISKVKPSEAIQQAIPLSFTGSLRGRKLAHFELLEPIGVGGMAAVLRARDTQLDRIVALKILPPDMARDEENVRRFHQEARAAARLDHENIARVFYCGEDQSLHFIAFEFVEGFNLRVLLENRGRLPVAEAVRIILQIATGLEHAASRGVVHRDVKPSNIIISPNGRAKLVDMGLARSLEPGHDGGLTQSGVTLGTFDYISPEQALEPREADSRSDIYSLGCTFYHMLTGQVPVPEGTAAKKLHHHQNVAPTDPRQLNPAIPDDVAAVLSRMMAKDPKDRYARPVHLVRHLLQVAQKVGAADDIPEGVLFVDAPLPVDRGKRPLLLISLGSLALALLLMVLSLAPQPKGPVQAGKTGPPYVDKPTALKDAGASVPLKVKAPMPGYFALANEQDLAQLLAEPGNITSATLENSLELPEGGLVYLGDGKHNLVIDCKDVYEPKTIRFKYSGKPESADTAAGLTIDGGNLTFRNIKFEIEAHATPERVVACLCIKGSGTVLFQNCIFVQRDVPQRPFILERKSRVPVASITVDNPEGALDKRPRIVLDQCSFSGGQVAISSNGPAEILPTDCAFKPYGALFHLRGDNPSPVVLGLQRCEAFVINGPAFRLDEAATCELTVRHSIFSRPDNAPSEDRDEPDLIRQTDKAELAVKFEGARNCYHNLNALWVRPKAVGIDICTELEEFRALVLEAGGRGDSDSSRLTKDIPIWVSLTPWQEDSLRAAFKLRPDVPQVRDADLKKGLGFEKLGKLEFSLPPFAKEETKNADIKLKANEKLVDAESTENPGMGIFNSLHKALVFAHPGDVVLIKHGKLSREVRIDPTPLDKPKVDVTLKSFPGESPAILKLDRTQDADPAFFRMYDGQMVFEQLEFALEPDQVNFNSMAVVFMGGNAECTFKNCVITMRVPDAVKQQKRVPLSAVTLADPDTVMKMAEPSERPVARVRLYNSLVRGEGEVLTVRASRPLELEVNNTLLALSGSLLDAQAGAKEPASGAQAKLYLDHVSAFLSEPLLAFRAGKNPKGFVRTSVEAAQNSLFVGLGSKPFVLIEASEITETGPRDYLDWKGNHNAYGQFDKMLAVRPDDDAQILESWNKTRWIEHYMETSAKFLPAQLNVPSMAGRALWNVGPDFFAAQPEQTEELSSYGASLEMLPRLVPGKKDP